MPIETNESDLSPNSAATIRQRFPNQIAHKKSSSALVEKQLFDARTPPRRTQSEIPSKIALTQGAEAGHSRVLQHGLDLDELVEEVEYCEDSSETTHDVEEEVRKPRDFLLMSLPPLTSLKGVTFDQPEEPPSPAVVAHSPTEPTVTLFDGPVSLDSTIKSIFTIYLFPLILLLALYRLLRGKMKNAVNK